MAKAEQQIVIDFMLSCLENGESRENILAKVVKKWQISTRTFDRRLKIANEIHNKRHKAASDAANKAYIATKENAAIEAVMSAQERKEVLTKIGRGEIPLTKPMVVDGAVELIPVVPDWMDRRAAIAELNKMEGDYSPTKTAATTVDGKDAVQTFAVSLFNSPVDLIEKDS
jgi:hypothetical protein